MARGFDRGGRRRRVYLGDCERLVERFNLRPLRRPRKKFERDARKRKERRDASASAFLELVAPRLRSTTPTPLRPSPSGRRRKDRSRSELSPLLHLKWRSLRK